jgi:hypothetical protein
MAFPFDPVIRPSIILWRKDQRAAPESGNWAGIKIALSTYEAHWKFVRFRDGLIIFPSSKGDISWHSEKKLAGAKIDQAV